MRNTVLLAISIGVAAVALPQHSVPGMGSNARLLAAVSSPQTPASAIPPDGSVQPPVAEMRGMHERMMADMKAADAKLDELVKSMNAATGDAKVSAMAQVITELVREQKTTHEHMGMMNQQMMPMMMGGRGMMKK